MTKEEEIVLRMLENKVATFDQELKSTIQSLIAEGVVKKEQFEFISPDNLKVYAIKRV